MTTTTEVVDITVDIRDAAVSTTAFGMPLIAAYHNFWPETVRTFSDVVELTVPAINVPTTHPIYLQAQALKAQKPSPSQFKVGKRSGIATQAFTLVPATPPAGGATYTFQIDGKPLTASVPAAGTLAQACTAIAAAITAAATGITPTATATQVTCVASVPGTRHPWSCSSANISYLETTPEPAITVATDLNTIRSADQNWYGLTIDSVGPAEIIAAANWAETQVVLFFPTLADSAVWGAGSTDVGSQLKAASLQRTIPLWHHRGAEQWADTGWEGKMFPKTPGSANWANQSLSLVDVSNLDDTQRGNMRTKNVNYYVPVKGVPFTLDGRASGGRYADITIGIDWFVDALQSRIVGVLANNDKVPYTDQGIQLIRGQVDAQILEAITATIADGAQPWSSSAPKVADVNPTDKIARILRNVKFQFVLQGAINKVFIQGTVLVA